VRAVVRFHASRGPREGAASVCLANSSPRPRDDTDGGGREELDRHRRDRVGDW
jgi:hypothetical protein